MKLLIFFTFTLNFRKKRRLDTEAGLCGCSPLLYINTRWSQGNRKYTDSLLS